MLTAAKNQVKIMLLQVKYNLMREMTNSVTFVMNVVFMILNNATFIVQWIILFSLKDNFGGYGLSDVLLLWALATTSYGMAHRITSYNVCYTKLLRPKKLGDTIVGCEYCPFGDICYKNENNIVELKEHKDLDFLGGENNDTN